MKTTLELDGGLSITIEPDGKGVRFIITGGTAYMDITRPGVDGAVFYAAPGNAIHERPPELPPILEQAKTPEARIERRRRREGLLEGRISL